MNLIEELTSLVGYSDDERTNKVLDMDLEESQYQMIDSADSEDFDTNLSNYNDLSLGLIRHDEEDDDFKILTSKRKNYRFWQLKKKKQFKKFRSRSSSFR